MAHQTWEARYHAKIGKTKTQLTHESIQQLQEQQQEREDLLKQASASGWQEEHDTWLLYHDGTQKAEFFKTPDRWSFTAVVWHDGNHAEHDSCADASSAMRWCDDRLRAARLNARADEAMTGAVDPTEDSVWDEHLVAGQ